VIEGGGFFFSIKLGKKGQLMEGGIVVHKY